MTDQISPEQFRESEGVEDWRVLGDGANAYFRTGSFAAGARLVQAISELPGVDGLRPEIDLRNDGVTVRMLTIADDYAGMLQQHVELARQISAAARNVLAWASAVNSMGREYPPPSVMTIGIWQAREPERSNSWRASCPPESRRCPCR